tara:strand:- start:1069 stop:1308 length:240 start_codon:yes stop_codon:yes gene_type:complete
LLNELAGTIKKVNPGALVSDGGVNGVFLRQLYPRGLNSRNGVAVAFCENCRIIVENVQSEGPCIYGLDGHNVFLFSFLG